MLCARLCFCGCASGAGAGRAAPSKKRPVVRALVCRLRCFPEGTTFRITLITQCGSAVGLWRAPTAFIDTPLLHVGAPIGLRGAPISLKGAPRTIRVRGLSPQKNGYASGYVATENYGHNTKLFSAAGALLRSSSYLFELI